MSNPEEDLWEFYDTPLKPPKGPKGPKPAYPSKSVKVPAVRRLEVPKVPDVIKHAYPQAVEPTATKRLQLPKGAAGEDVITFRTSRFRPPKESQPEVMEYTESPESPRKAPKARAARKPRAPKGLPTPKAEKAPKAPKAEKAPRAPKAPKAEKAPRAPKAPKAEKAPRARAPRAAVALIEASPEIARDFAKSEAEWNRELMARSIETYNAHHAARAALAEAAFLHGVEIARAQARTATIVKRLQDDFDRRVQYSRSIGARKEELAEAKSPEAARRVEAGFARKLATLESKRIKAENALRSAEESMVRKKTASLAAKRDREIAKSAQTTRMWIAGDQSRYE